MSDFTDRIDILLEQTHQRRADLCRGTDIPDSTIRNWIRGKIPSIDNVVKVAEYFGCSVEWLVTGKTTDNQEPIKPNPLSNEEEDLVSYYRMLDEHDRSFLLFTAKNMTLHAKELKVAEAKKDYDSKLV